MEIVDKEDIISKLREANMPFVLFREPSKPAKFLVQDAELEQNKLLNISQRGFYLFPFSRNEESMPLFFRPDYINEWESIESFNFNIRKLALPEIRAQELFEVDQDNYMDDLKKYLLEFEGGTLQKAIYSRVRNENLDQSLNISQFFKDLSHKYPKAFTYVVNIPGDGMWIGASPELLLSYSDGRAKTVALAGTLKINRNIPAPEWTRKEIDEHRLVEKHIMKLCDDMNLDYEKSAVRSSSTGKVYHLKSDFSIKITPDEIINFLSDLHPTPAISGLPQKESLDLIYKVEKHQRSYYCGFLGWVEDIDNFKLFINLRCLKLQGRQYSLFAGGGITPDSDIKKEWDETEIKMATLTDLLPKEYSFSEQ